MGSVERVYDPLDPVVKQEPYPFMQSCAATTR